MGAFHRHCRWMLGMTQQELGDKIGATLQEIQAYERGTTRISEIVMLEIADSMEMATSFFFDDVDGQEPVAEALIAITEDALELSRSYFTIPRKHRSSLFRVTPANPPVSRSVEPIRFSLRHRATAASAETRDLVACDTTERVG